MWMLSIVTGVNFTTLTNQLMSKNILLPETIDHIPLPRAARIILFHCHMMAHFLLVLSALLPSSFSLWRTLSHAFPTLKAV